MSTVSRQISVLAILVGAASLIGYTVLQGTKSDLTSCMDNQRAIYSALMHYFDDTLIEEDPPMKYPEVCHGSFPASLNALAPRFLAKIPKCPTAEGRPYDYRRYSDIRVAGDFVLSCPGYHPGVKEGYPKANFRQGVVLDPRECIGSDGKPGSIWLWPTNPDIAPTLPPSSMRRP